MGQKQSPLGLPKVGCSTHRRHRPWALTRDVSFNTRDSGTTPSAPTLRTRLRVSVFAKGAAKGGCRPSKKQIVYKKSMGIAGGGVSENFKQLYE